MTQGSGGSSPNRREVLKLMGVAPVFGRLQPGHPLLGDGLGRKSGSAVGAAIRGQTLGGLTASLAGSDLSVALADGTAVVGMPPRPTPGGADAGSMALFTRMDGTWRRETTFRAPSGGSQFGAAVTFDGTTALVGAPLGGVAGASHGGYVVVYSRRGDAWTRETTLRRAEATGLDSFGGAVAVDGHTAVVGARTATTEHGFRTGCTSVVVRENGTWNRQASLLPPADVDAFGTAVALDRDTLVVGARDRRRGAPSNASGVAFVYRRVGGTWRRWARLTSPSRTRDDGFGTALALDGDTLLVGAPTETNDRGTNAGAAYVFTRTAGRWGSAETLRPTDGAADEQFGASAALDGNTAVVASRAAPSPVVFSRANGTWTERSCLEQATDGLPTRTGTDVAIDGTRALVAVSGGADEPEPRDGAVLLFEP